MINNFKQELYAEPNIFSNFFIYFLPRARIQPIQATKQQRNNFVLFHKYPGDIQGQFGNYFDIFHP